MDLQKLINSHDHEHNFTDPKECPCDLGKVIQREFMRNNDEKVEELVKLHNSHTKWEDCPCPLANAIRNYQLAFQNQISMGVFVKDKEGQILPRLQDDRAQDISYESIHLTGGSSLTPDSYMRLHSRILPRLSGLDNESVLDLIHSLQILVDGAKAGLGIVKAYHSDNLKRATEEERSRLTKKDKEWKETPKKNIGEKVKINSEIEKEMKKLEKLMKSLEMMNKGKK